MNAFLALCIGLVIWALLLACVLALVGFESFQEEAREIAKKTRRVRAGTAYGQEVAK